MSWLLSLQDASFKGRKFDVVSTDDQGARDVATYEKPYVDGAETEDLGRKARQFTIRAVFFGLFYEDSLNTFLTLLDDPGPGELVHPVFGSIPQAQLLTYRVGHDADRPDYADVDLTFIEHEDSTPFYSTAGSTFDELMSGIEMVQAMIEAVAAFGEFVGALVGAVVGGAFGLISQITGIGSMTGGIMANLKGLFPGSSSTSSDYTQSPNAFGADVAAAVAGLSDGRTYETLPEWNEMVVDAKDVIALPASMAALPGEDQVEDVSGTAVAAVSIAPADLEKIETVLVVAVAADVLDTAMQILAAQRDNPTLTPAEIEQIVNDARWFVLRALDKNRSAWGSVRARPITEPLKSTAKHIQDLGLAIISLRPPLIERRTAGAGNLHLIAHAWYGDYSRADELLRLNPQIRNPNDIRPGEVLNAYAE